MARIRSVHPGQWTDDNFVTCSPLARLLSIGLRNEADDNGVFEWKPLTLKMRLVPADNSDISELLEELAASGQIVRFSAGTRSFGIIRNFTKFQKPKKPSFIYPVPSELPDGCELHPYYHRSVPPTVENQFPSGGGNSIQMERRGEERREEERREEKRRGEKVVGNRSPASIMYFRERSFTSSKRTTKVGGETSLRSQT